MAVQTTDIRNEVEDVKQPDYQASLRLARDEWEEWAARARAEGVSTAQWVRRVCNERASLMAGGEQRKTPDGGVVLGVGLPPAMVVEVKRRAAEHFRTPELEVLAMVAEALKTAGGDQ